MSSWLAVICINKTLKREIIDTNDLSSSSFEANIGATVVYIALSYFHLDSLECVIPFTGCHVS